MEVKIKGSNYTGAHFRGIKDEFDGISCEMVLKGKEKKIIKFIRENFSYGDDDGINFIEDLARDLKKGIEPLFDGCGGCVVIEVDGKKLLDIRKDCGFSKKEEWTDLGTIDVDEIEDCFDYVTALIRQR